MNIIINLIGYIAALALAIAAGTRWIDDTQTETRKAFSTKQKAATFAAAVGYVGIAYLAGYLLFGWLIPLIAAGILAALTVYLSLNGVSTWKVSLLEQGSLLFAGCLASRIHDLNTLKSASTYLIIAAVFIVATVALEKLILADLNKGRTPAQATAPAAPAASRVNNPAPAAQPVAQPAQSLGEPVTIVRQDAAPDQLHQNVRDSVAVLDAQYVPAQNGAPQSASTPASAPAQAPTGNTTVTNGNSNGDSTPIWKDILLVVAVAAVAGLAVWMFVAVFAPAFGILS